MDRRLRTLERVAAVAAALERESTFAARAAALARAVGGRVDALDAEGEPFTAGELTDGERLPLAVGGRAFGTLTLPPGDPELATLVAARASTSLDAARLLESERRARLRMSALQDATSELAGAATAEAVGAAIAEHGARALAGTGGTVYMLDAGVLHVVASWGYRDEEIEPFRAIALDAQVPLAEAAREGHAVFADADLAERYPALPGASGSLCAVPLVAGTEVLGAVGVSRASGRPFRRVERELLEALGRQGALALLRSRLYDRLHRLQDTTAALARALTPREVAQTAAAQGAEALNASSAWVALLDDTGRALELAHAAGHAPETQERFRMLPLDAPLPLAQAARTQQPIWLQSAEELFGRYPRFSDVRAQAQSAALLPLLDDGVALGAIGLVFDDPHAFGPEDRDYLLALTRLCGQALGRARRYQTEHDVASTLQQALLPERLPSLDGVSLAVRYVPATDFTEAGGDFYEALELPGGRLGIAIGDVVGHGPAAAAAMGQLRSALRAYALEGRAPARVLQLLSRYADAVTGARGATLVYAVLDPVARELRFACAGHPPPLLVSADGHARFLEGARGVPLDRSLGYLYEDTTAVVGDASTLILYSDGAVERRDESLDVGLERLAQAASAAASLAPDALCTRLLEAQFADARMRDDVALLVARTSQPAIAPLRLWFAARPDQLSVVREAMRSWLDAAGVAAGDGELVVLAAGELCANAVEHAYAADVEAAVEIALAREPDGALSLLVRDRGRWRPPPLDPGNRGRGLSIVRALMHGVDIDESADGTSVSVRYRPGSAPARLPPPPGHPAALSLSMAGEVAVAEVTGEIDSANAVEIGRTLLALPPGPLVVNLSSTGFLGSAGLRVLFALAAARDGVAVVAPREASFRRALEVSELGRVVILALSLTDALEQLS